MRSGGEDLRDLRAACAGVEVLARRDFEAARRLIDQAMRPDAAYSMSEDFPLLVGPHARSDRLVLREGGRLVAHVAARYAVFDLPGEGALRLANVGAVATEAAARGRGHARRLLAILEERARRRGCELAILWSGLGGFYRRLGYAQAGAERSFRVRQADLRNAAAVERARERDLPEILALRERDPCGLRRSLAEATLMFRIPDSRTWILRRQGRVDAYLVLGKGQDYPGLVAEWGGPADLLPALLGGVLVAQALPETVVSGPVFDASFAAALRGVAAAEALAPLLWVKPLRPERLRRLLPPSLDAGSNLATALLGGPGDERGGALPFYVWGLDSM